MSIPKGFIDEYLKDAESCIFFGVPIQELTRDELIACAIAGWKKESEERFTKRKFPLRFQIKTG